MIKASMTIIGPPRGMMKVFSQITKEEMQNLIVNWHKERLPRHFKNAAIQEYDYTPRSIRYQRYKDKRHLGPLVFRGKTRELMSRMIRVSGTSSKVKGAMDAPKYMYYRRPGHPDKIAEVTAVSQEEISQMAATLDKKVGKRLNDIRDKEVIT